MDKVLQSIQTRNLPWKISFFLDCSTTATAPASLSSFSLLPLSRTQGIALAELKSSLSLLASPQTFKISLPAFSEPSKQLQTSHCSPPCLLFIGKGNGSPVIYLGRKLPRNSLINAHQCSIITCNGLGASRQLPLNCPITVLINGLLLELLA